MISLFVIDYYILLFCLTVLFTLSWHYKYLLVLSSQHCKEEFVLNVYSWLNKGKKKQNKKTRLIFKPNINSCPSSYRHFVLKILLQQFQLKNKVLPTACYAHSLWTAASYQKERKFDSKKSQTNLSYFVVWTTRTNKLHVYFVMHIHFVQWSLEVNFTKIKTSSVFFFQTKVLPFF